MTKEQTVKNKHEREAVIAEPISEMPLELDAGGFKVKVPWKLIVLILTVIVGGGGAATIATTLGVGSTASADLTAFETVQEAAHIGIDKALVVVGEKAAAQDAKIETVTKVVQSVQTIQQRDVSRNEARRLTENITSRAVREREYDRLYELNLNRLQRGSDPCGTVQCD
jgi:hypothetical protein